MPGVECWGKGLKAAVLRLAKLAMRQCSRLGLGVMEEEGASRDSSVDASYGSDMSSVRTRNRARYLYLRPGTRQTGAAGTRRHRGSACSGVGVGQDCWSGGDYLPASDHILFLSVGGRSQKWNSNLWYKPWMAYRI